MSERRPPWDDPVFTDAVATLQPMAEHIHRALNSLTRLRWSAPKANPTHAMSGFGAVASMSAKDGYGAGAGWWELEAILIHDATGVEVSVSPPRLQYPGWRRTPVGRLDLDRSTWDYASDLIRYAPPPLSMVLRSPISDSDYR